MLKPIRGRKEKNSGGRFAIVASQYNARYVDAMVRAARKELAKVESVQIVRVPGAFEIPLATAKLARAETPFSAIICLGIILRGATSHAQHIGEGVTRALMTLQLECEIPIIHEVLLLENEEQARERCLGSKFNRGKEAAQTAMTMAAVLKTLGSN